MSGVLGLPTYPRVNVCACVRRQVKITISERDQFIIMGCDGFWRVFTNQARRTFGLAP